MSAEKTCAKCGLEHRMMSGCVVTKLWQLIDKAGLLSTEHHGRLALDLSVEVSMLEDEVERLRQSRDYYVRWIRRLEGLDDNGNLESFGSWIARKLGFRS